MVAAAPWLSVSVSCELARPPPRRFSLHSHPWGLLPGSTWGLGASQTKAQADEVRPTAVGWSPWEGHFRGRGGGPLPVLPQDSWAWAAPHLRGVPGLLQVLVSSLSSSSVSVHSLPSLSVSFCFCPSTEANTTQTGRCAQERGRSPWRTVDFSGKNKGHFWTLVCWVPDHSPGPLPLCLSLNHWMGHSDAMGVSLSLY